MPSASGLKASTIESRIQCNPTVVAEKQGENLYMHMHGEERERNGMSKGSYRQQDQTQQFPDFSCECSNLPYTLTKILFTHIKL